MATFKVDIELKGAFLPEFISLIPLQRKVVDDMMNAGKIVSYALSIDRTHLWIVMEGKNEQQILDLLAQFPLIRYMKPQIYELAFYDSIHSGFPQLSLN